MEHREPSDAGVTNTPRASTRVSLSMQQPSLSTSSEADATKSMHMPEKGTEESTALEASEPPYSVHPTDQKVFVIIAGSFAALISPLSSSIYLPALDTLAQEMNVSVPLINLTITTYLVSSGDSSLLATVLTMRRSSRASRRPSSAVFLMHMADVQHTSSRLSFISVPTSGSLFRTATVL